MITKSEVYDNLRKIKGGKVKRFGLKKQPLHTYQLLIITNGKGYQLYLKEPGEWVEYYHKGYKQVATIHYDTPYTDLLRLYEVTTLDHLVDKVYRSVNKLLTEHRRVY